MDSLANEDQEARTPGEQEACHLMDSLEDQEAWTPGEQEAGTHEDREARAAALAFLPTCNLATVGGRLP